MRELKSIIAECAGARVNYYRCQSTATSQDDTRHISIVQGFFVVLFGIVIIANCSVAVNTSHAFIIRKCVFDLPSNHLRPRLVARDLNVSFFGHNFSSKFMRRVSLEETENGELSEFRQSHSHTSHAKRTKCRLGATQVIIMRHRKSYPTTTTTDGTRSTQHTTLNSVSLCEMRPSALCSRKLPRLRATTF